MGDEGLRTAGMQTFADRSVAYTSKLNDAGFADGGRQPGTPEEEAAHRALLSQNAVQLGRTYPRMLVKDWRLNNPDPGFIVKGDATNIKEALTERFKYNKVSNEFEVTLIGDHYVSTDVRPPTLDWVLTHEAKDEQQALMTSLVQTLLRIKNGREFQLQDATTEVLGETSTRSVRGAQETSVVFCYKFINRSNFVFILYFRSLTGGSGPDE